ncbi:iron ABC transporter permease [Ruania suaedae]|uniref:FecCD family ABC transporter permease n=1 Tax=Ruania suaedae TaxID=2897774 RepID=UPI001E5AFB62|nr:iron ABC transporter permease [Ruania suaedae]UFU01920.1 iron ABC transporter permease [Ruania suaedae]
MYTTDRGHGHPRTATDAPLVAAAGATRRRRGLLILALLTGVALVCILAVGIGPVPIAPSVVAEVVLGHLGLADPGSVAATDDSIVWLIRLPRVILGAVVGASLALAGVVIQALVRNPLADPYLLGISSGASVGAAASILFGIGGGVLALTGSAFVGAVGAIALVLSVARIGGRLITSRLVFAGIAVGFALTALTNFLVFASESRDGARAVMFWMLGSLAQSRWASVPLAVVAVVVAAAIFIAWARRLDALAIGDDTALALGTDPARFRALAVIVVSLVVAVAVSVSGLIGFVGLVVPHIARRLVGGSHRIVLPVSALLGALLLVSADAIARIAFAPRELPLGILTALIGTPLLIALVRRSLAR